VYEQNSEWLIERASGPPIAGALVEHYYRGVRDVVALEQIRSCFRAINGAIVERETDIPAPWLVLEKCVWSDVWRGFVPNPHLVGPSTW